MRHRKVRGLNNKSKVTYIIIGLATTAFVVAFLFNRPSPPSAEEKVDEPSTKVSKASPDNHDHTITADMHVHQDEDQAPVIKVTRDGVESEGEKWEAEFFNNYLDETLESLPNLDQLKGLKNKDVHHQPGIVMEAGLRLGKIKKQVKMNQDFGPKAMEFYSKCAAKKKSFTPVRGLCLANLMIMSKQKGQTVDTSSYPEPVVEMAKKALEFSF